MLQQGGGSIINITSGSASVRVLGSAMRHHSLYAMTKAALDRFTTYLAEELRPLNIAVDALSPGPVITDGLLARFPEDSDFESGEYAWHEAGVEYLGPPVVHLAGQDARGITGQVLRIADFGKTRGS